MLANPRVEFGSAAKLNEPGTGAQSDEPYARRGPGGVFADTRASATGEPIAGVEATTVAGRAGLPTERVGISVRSSALPFRPKRHDALAGIALAPVTRWLILAWERCDVPFGVCDLGMVKVAGPPRRTAS